MPEPPSGDEIGRALRLIEPIRKVINPKVYGIDNVPRRRAAGRQPHRDGHARLAAHVRRTVRARHRRPLPGDHAHFKIPVWRDVLTACGVVEGTRAITAELMRRGEVILVYPAVAGWRKGENTNSFGRNGWVSPGWPSSTATRSCRSPRWAPRKPSTSSWTGTAHCSPRPAVRREAAGQQRCHADHPWHRADPHSAAGTAVLLVRRTDLTETVQGQQDDDAVVRAVREQVKQAVERGMEFLLTQRENDPHRSVVRRLLGPGAGSRPCRSDSLRLRSWTTPPSTP